MRYFIIYFLVTFFSVGVYYNVNGQTDWLRNPVTFDPVVCYSSGEVEKGFVPPPEYILNRLKSGKGKKSDMIVSYNNFPDSVKNAFEYAVGIWEQFIESDIPIYISATWRSMGENTLASCGPSGYYQNFNGVPYADRYYPVAVVEKIVGFEITDSNSPDITASFNKNVDWYFGTDGETPNNLHDFVSTVMHEIAHGLGFVGFFYEDDGMGGFYSPPAIFDEFVTNSYKKNLIYPQNYNNPSLNLLNALKSNALFFKGPVTFFDSEKSLPRLYAPSVWSDGSSVYHLNDATYPRGNTNSLMTHSAGLGEAIHDPGSLTLGMLADMGWKHLWIDHDELKDLEIITEPVFVEASIKSDYKLDSTKLFVYYSSNTFYSVDSVLMKATKKPTYFKAELPVETENGIISYYIQAVDEKQRVYRAPYNAPLSDFKLRIGPDTISPIITHKPEDYILNNVSDLLITVFADDNVGLDSVWVEYFINDQDMSVIGLKLDSVTTYSGEIDLLPFQIQDQDIISYRIGATDISQSQNQTYLPNDGYFTVKVESIYDPIYKYVNTFNGNSNDFLGLDFEVKEEKGFLDGALHSLHPYESPEQNDMFFNYMVQLKYPIILLENAQMNFDEIVLVEPGESGSEFGDLEFWDFVIVEGSKNSGETWLPLINGYDSRIVPSWQIEYNNGINNKGNSSTIGIKEMFVKRSIDMLANGNFIAGDTIDIRFRLFSDPYANGWGWVIDNLRIQTVVSSEKQLSISPGNFRIYPNPFDKNVMVEYNSKDYTQNINIAVYDSFGRRIIMENVNSDGFGFKRELNLNEYKAGIYFIRLSSEGQHILSRRIIKQ